MPITRALRIMLAAFVAALSVGSVGSVAAQTFVLFDLPGTEGGVNADIKPRAINASAAVAGHYTVAISEGGDGLSRGFIRSADGTLLIVDTPGGNTTLTGINERGATIGTANGAFIRSPDGTVTIFDVPGARGTNPLAINAQGDIAGFYGTDEGEAGFVLTAAGVLTRLTGADSLYAMLVGINDLGDAAGTLLEPVGDSGVPKGVVLSHDGQQTRFQAQPGAPGYIKVAGINNSGSVAGYAANEVCLPVPHTPCFDVKAQGFVRTAGGRITRFAVQDGRRARKTYVRGINGAGTVVGEHVGNANDPAAPVGGFVRDSAGTLVSFQVPGMTSTYPTAINDSGVIVGWCRDAQNNTRGFLRLP